MDIRLNSDGIDKNNRTLFCSGSCCERPPGPKSKTAPAFARVCLCGSRAPELFSEVSPTMCFSFCCFDGLGPSSRIFCSVFLSSVQSHQRRKPVQLLPGLLQPSAVLCVTCSRGGLRTARWEPGPGRCWVPTPCFGVKPQAQCRPVLGSWWQSLKPSSGHWEGAQGVPSVPALSKPSFSSEEKQPAKWWLANVFWFKTA